MGVTCEKAAVAAVDRQEWRQSKAQGHGTDTNTTTDVCLNENILIHLHTYKDRGCQVCSKACITNAIQLRYKYDYDEKMTCSFLLVSNGSRRVRHVVVGS